MNGVAAADSRVERLIRPDVRAMHGYVVQPSDGYVKLDAMENPFRLPPALRQALGARLADVAINRYPGSRIEELRAALAEHVGVPEGFGLMLGNGSDELISMLAMACDTAGATVLAPEPGFVMYAMSARLLGLDYVGVPLRADFGLDVPAMLAAIERHRPALIYLGYPNNPTANLYDDDAVARIVDAAPGFVVIDEAYQPFSSRSWLGRIGGFEHVLLMRTLSKFGLAGVRVGYLVAPQAVIDEVDKVRPPYNISVLNAEAALFALEHADEYGQQAALLRAERERLSRALADLPGVEPFPSEANMILVRVPDAAALFGGLKQRGVLVKNVSALHPLLAGCLRLTVGAPAENDQLLAALQSTLQAA